MRKFRKFPLLLLTLAVAAVTTYWLLIVFPQFFFRLERIENLYIYHHANDDAVRAVGERALAKIKRSNLYDPRATYRVFLTGSAAEYAFFTSLWRNSGGVFLIFARGNVFIRPSIVEEDRLIAPSGELVAADRPLNYFIAHEAAHAMTYERLGFVRYLELNQWVREGVADKIARDEFDFEQMSDQYRSGHPAMDYRRSGLYLKFQLLVEFAVRHLSYSEESLLERNPTETEIENALISFGRP